MDNDDGAIASFQFKFRLQIPSNLKRTTFDSFRMTCLIRNARIRLTQGQLFSREAGHGTALVFLHGSWADGDQWLPVVESLSEDYHCIVPDLLGFGDSDRPTAHQSIELQVESLAEYLELLKLRQVYLIGHSVGGWIAASYALHYPNQVKGLVLIGAEGVQLDASPNRWLLARWLTSRPPILFWLLRLLRLMGWRQFTERSLQLRQQLRRSPTACQLLFQRRKSEIQAELLHDRLSWLKLPILIVQGEQDNAIAASLNRVYATAPDATLAHIPEASGDVLETAPTAVADHIQEFVTQ